MAALQDSLEKSPHSEVALFALHWSIVTFACGIMHILVMIRLRAENGGRRVGHVLLLYQNRQISALGETADAPQSSLLPLLSSPCFCVACVAVAVAAAVAVAVAVAVLLCCCVLLYVVVLCVSMYVGGERGPCVRSKRSRVYIQNVHMGAFQRATTTHTTQPHTATRHQQHTAPTHTNKTPKTHTQTDRDLENVLSKSINVWGPKEKRQR